MPTLVNGKRQNGKRGGGWITKERRLAIYLRDEFRCAYCGCDLHGAHPRQLNLDHLVPRIHKGTNESSNLVLACLPCNASRQDKAVHHFATGGALKRIANLKRRSMTKYLRLAKAILAGQTGTPDSESAR